ncbi:MAG: Gldg family protein [Clostridia bacterium]|nr:Gldg family protein [Clostridia bacterium]
MFAVITVAAIILALVLNLLITYVGLHNSMYIDTTPEGLYTLTDAMKRECDFIDELDNDERCVKITFCADPDTLTASELTRVTYFMALKLAARYDNLEVETVNVEYNPTALSQYKSTSLKTINQSDVIVSYGDRYRIVSANRFWVTASDDELWSYNGEYRMATLIKSVTAVDRPAAYFVTDHGESYYDINNPESEMSLDNAYLYDLIEERGMEVKTLEISSVDEIPEDCVLLIINNPKTDFLFDEDKIDELGYISDTEKLDRYLVKRQGAIMVARDYDESRREPLPVLDAFLREWGFAFGDSLVLDDENYMTRDDGTFKDVVGELDTDEDSYGYAIYGDLAAVGTAPPTVFSDTGYIECSYPGSESVPEDGTLSTGRNYATLIDTYDTAYAVKTDDSGMLGVENVGKMTLAATTTRIYLDSVTAENRYSYVFCANSPSFFSSEVLGNLSYSNYDVVSSLVENIARIDNYASIELGGISGNSQNVGGKQLVDTTLSTSATDEKYAFKTQTATGFTVAIMLVPVAVLVCGIVVSIRRRFL